MRREEGDIKPHLGKRGFWWSGSDHLIVQDDAPNSGSIVPNGANAEGEDDLFRVMQELLRGIPGWTWILAAELAFVGALIVLCVAGWRARTLADTADWFLRAAGLVVIAAVLAGLGAIATLSTSGKGDAVVMQDNVVTRMGPGERYLEHLSLPAGTLVELPEAPSDGWVRCRLLDGRTGYIRTETLERL